MFYPICSNECFDTSRLEPLSCFRAPKLLFFRWKVVSIYLAPYRSGSYSIVQIELIAIAAVLEGALIGHFQWRVLRRLFPTMTSGSWVGATMIAAGSGCVLSWLPKSYALTAALANRIEDVTQGPTVIVRISLVTGALVGLVWGGAQFAVLRLHVHRAGSWIVASTVLWTSSFVWLYLAAFFPDRTTNPVIQIALASLSGLALGSFLGMVHGRVLVRLTRISHQRYSEKPPFMA